MKKFMFVAAMLSMAPMSWGYESKDAVVSRLDAATTALHQIMVTPDKGIPEEVLEHAKCVALVPKLVKGGFVFGAEGGKGVATSRTASGWSAPAFFTVAGGSRGLQIGVEGIDLVMIFQNEKGMQDLLSSGFQVGGSASAAAGPVGRHALADTDWKMNAKILMYSRTKGVFAGLTLSGAVVHLDDDSMHASYGSDVTARQALSGQVPVPAQADTFLREVRNARAEAAANS